MATVLLPSDPLHPINVEVEEGDSVLTVDAMRGSMHFLALVTDANGKRLPVHDMEQSRREEHAKAWQQSNAQEAAQAAALQGLQVGAVDWQSIAVANGWVPANHPAARSGDVPQNPAPPASLTAGAQDFRSLSPNVPSQVPPAPEQSAEEKASEDATNGGETTPVE